MLIIIASIMICIFDVVLLLNNVITPDTWLIVFALVLVAFSIYTSINHLE